MYRFKIAPKQYEYLKNQCGDINSVEPYASWHAAYNEKQDKLYQAIKPYLPEKPNGILDIGSGLGGIDVLLDKHYGGAWVTLVDGDTGPEVVKANIPHSSHAEMASFLEGNGVRAFNLLTPEEFTNDHNKYNIIISYSAWCFHIAPEIYMQNVLGACRDDTRIFLKVRRGRGWLEQLDEHFKPTIINEMEKAVFVCLTPKRNHMAL